MKQTMINCKIIDCCGIEVAGSASAQNILFFLWQCRWPGTARPAPCSAGSCLTASVDLAWPQIFFLAYFRVIWGGLVSQQRMPRSISYHLLQHLTTGLILEGHRTGTAGFFQWTEYLPLLPTGGASFENMDVAGGLPGTETLSGGQKAM